MEFVWVIDGMFLKDKVIWDGVGDYFMCNMFIMVKVYLFELFCKVIWFYIFYWFSEFDEYLDIVVYSFWK